MPGSTLIWSGQHDAWEGEFKVLDVTQDANNTYVTTTMSDGFPSLGTVKTCVWTPLSTLRPLTTRAAPRHFHFLKLLPEHRSIHLDHTYSGNFGGTPSFEQWGELVSIKINVIKPYTGSKPSLDMEALGQFGSFVLDPDGSISRIDPTINLKVAGERYITSTSVTGLQPGDHISAPGPVSFTGALGAFMGLTGTLADISSDDPSTWPSVSIEIVTDQGFGGLGNTLDTIAATPAIALGADSGLAGDGITKVGTVNIAGLEAGATWQYAVNGGAFITGTGASFTLTGDGPKAVLVHQTDAAGNVSADASLNFTLATTAAAPSVALATDSGTAGDGITRIGTVNIAGLEAGATWQYAINGGSFITGTGASFTLTDDGPKAVLVHQTDAAGNVSADTLMSFTLDTIVATPAIALGADSGLAGDGITKIGTVDVAGLEAGATWQYAVNDGPLITGTGASFTLTGDGPKAVLVHQTDHAGNVSADALMSFTLDTIAPLNDTISTAGATVTNPVQSISGTGEAGSTIQLHDGAGTIGQAWVDGSGHWSQAITLSGAGSHAITAIDTDAAGNASTSNAITFMLNSGDIIPSPGQIPVNGAAGSDTLDLSGTTTAAFGSQIGLNLLSSTENVRGGSGNDTIIGSNGANQLEGGAGQDTITDFNIGTLLRSLGFTSVQDVPNHTDPGANAVIHARIDDVTLQHVIKAQLALHTVDNPAAEQHCWW